MGEIGPDQVDSEAEMEVLNSNQLVTRENVKRLADDDQKAWIEAATQAAEYNKEDNFFGMLLNDLRTFQAVDFIFLTLAAVTLFATTLAALFVFLPNLFSEAPLTAIISFLEPSASKNIPQKLELVTGTQSITTGATARALIVLALACCIALSFALWYDRASLLRQIHDIKEFGARQIYPCSGQITFTCGTRGIRITNALKSVSWQISWGALADTQALVEVTPSRTIANWFRSKNKKRFSLRSGRWLVPDDELRPSDTTFTHLVIYTKTYIREEIGTDLSEKKLDRSDRPNAEYLVIPLRFFSGAYDRTSWVDFVRLVRKYTSTANRVEDPDPH